MQIHSLPCGSQQSVTGNVVNVPVDIAPMVNILPQALQDSYIVRMKFKCKKSYKCSDFQEEYVWPLAVWKAVDYLVKNSPLYEQLNTQINTNWLNSGIDWKSELSNFIAPDDETNSHSGLIDASSSSDENSDNPDESERYSDPDNGNDQDTLHAGFIEQDTMLHQDDIRVPNITSFDKDITEINFAPGEGQKPISLFYDDNA